MNQILNNIIESRKGHYVHALEVSSVEELKSAVDALNDEFTSVYEFSEILNFFETIAIYSLSDENEDAIYDFDIIKYLTHE